MEVLDTDSHNVPETCIGVWQRLDGAGNTCRAYWVQTRRLHASVLIPPERPQCAGKASLAECSDEELFQLAAQSGVAGTCIIDGDMLQRRRQLDYQTTRGKPFIRRIHAEGDQLQEETTAGTEKINWLRISEVDAEIIALRFQDEVGLDIGGNRKGVLLVIGDHFIFLRDRAVFAPHSDSLQDLIECKEFTHAQLVELLDFEISFGLRNAGRMPWEIQLSTLPFREGMPLFKDGEFEAIVRHAGRMPQRIRRNGDTFMRRWSLDERVSQSASIP